MTFTLAQLTYRVAREMGIVKEGVATGGSTTTVVDANDRKEADNYWLDATVWILKDAAGAGAAPEGEVSIASASTSSTGTITVRTAFTVAPAVGDTYAVAYKFGADPWYHLLAQMVNRAIQDLGVVPQTDTTSITLASDQTEYTLPVAACQDLRQVWIQNRIDDANDNEWTELIRGSQWYIQENSTAGTGDALVLGEQPPVGYDLKLVYMAPHPQLLAATDKLTDHVPVERIVYPAALECFKHMKNVTGWQKWDAQISMYEQKAQAVRARFNIQRPRRMPGLIVPGSRYEPYIPPASGTVRLG